MWGLGLTHSYRLESGSSQACVYVSFQAIGRQSDARDTDAASVIGALRAAGHDVSDLRDNELAKSHLRHLGGGRAGVPNERLSTRSP